MKLKAISAMAFLTLLPAILVAQSFHVAKVYDATDEILGQIYSKYVDANTPKEALELIRNTDEVLEDARDNDRINDKLYHQMRFCNEYRKYHHGLFIDDADQANVHLSQALKHFKNGVELNHEKYSGLELREIASYFYQKFEPKLPRWRVK